MPAEGRLVRWTGRIDSMAGSAFVLPAVLVVLFMSIFPLLLSLYLSLTRLQFVPGGFKLSFVGAANYRKLFSGLDHVHFLGLWTPPTWLGWLVFLAGAGLMAWGIVRYLRREGPISIGGLIGRILAGGIAALILWMLVHSLTPTGRPGTITVTLIYVFVGVFFQYCLGLALAVLCTQRLPGRRFFRVVFLLPMMITPVGVAYMFRMLTDTQKGPFRPLWIALGLINFSWVTQPWGARAAVMIGDIWQWTPFMFIVLLAALEAQSIDQIEAAMVDGAGGWQVFRHVTLPQILPVSTTLVLIRMIEAFKIVDLPNVLTNGGPGTATESLTLEAYFSWRTLDLGGSAAIAYVLLFVATFAALSFVSFTRRRAEEG